MRLNHQVVSPTERRGGQAGFSLLETLIALIVMGLAFGSILGGLTTAIMVTRDNKLRSEADAQARVLAEAVKRSDAPFAYVPCATPTTYSNFTNVGLKIATGWQVKVTRVQYWIKPSGTNPAATDTYTPPDVYGAAVCQPVTLTTNSGTLQVDSGTQRITIKATPPVNTWRGERNAQTIVVIKRDTRNDCYLVVGPLGGSC